MIRRAELGKLIADPNNEMLGKAFVNRMWAHFLGRGFVNPVDDFGPHNPPSHPELLDKLAEEFKESGYDVKKLCRWIMASRAYQLSSMLKTKGEREGRGAVQPDAAQADDPGAALRLAADGDHGPSRRLGRRRQSKRDAWLRQFLFTFANDEAEESTSFQGTIPQALMMMNGELMQDGALRQAGQLPGRVIEQARRQATVARSLHGRFHLPGGPEPASLGQGARPGAAVPRSVSRQPPGLARPVLGPPELQRICPDSLELDGSIARRHLASPTRRPRDRAQPGWRSTRSHVRRHRGRLTR